MNRLENISKEVESLYGQGLSSREGWADWLSLHHVPVVRKYARQLAKRYGCDEELAEVAALLHDIADYRLPRDDASHETASLEIARNLMKKHGYNAQEIETVVDDAIKFHSCKNNERPSSKVGLVLAAADSMAHLNTDFYSYAVAAMAKRQPYSKTRAWILSKIDRDLNDKITFTDLREEERPQYELIKRKYSA